MVVRDLNTTIEKEEDNQNVARKKSIVTEMTNNNEVISRNLASAANTYIVRTKIKHEIEHKITRMISGRIEEN